MHITCCDNPVHQIDNVEHRFDSYAADLRATVAWVCMTCGARTTIDNMRIDAKRDALLHEAITDARGHSFTTAVKQRYSHNNELDIEDGGVVTPSVVVR